MRANSAQRTASARALDTESGRPARARSAAGGRPAVAGVLPGTGSRAELAAWTVTRKPAGLVVVTIRQLSDPAGLQRTLRKDGVPAVVRFNGQSFASCLGFPLTSGRALREILPSNYDGATTAFTINTAAIPPGAALWIDVTPQTTNSSGVSSSGMSVQLVYASGRCPAPAS